MLDLQTGEGALVRPYGHAKCDFDKHQVWVCPLFEPFLKWLYEQNLAEIDRLPAAVKIDNPASAMPAGDQARQEEGSLTPENQRHTIRRYGPDHSLDLQSRRH